MIVKTKKGKEYNYDYDRSTYMRKYYERKRDELLPKAIKRYRNKVIAKFTQPACS